MITDYKADLTVRIDEKTVLLTEEILEEFVERYVDLAARELVSAREGKSILNALDYSWKNKK